MYHYLIHYVCILKYYKNKKSFYNIHIPGGVTSTEIKKKIYFLLKNLLQTSETRQLY